MLVVWIVRLVLLAVFLPLLVPFAALAATFVFAPMPIALLLLALALLALAVVVGLVLGVLGTLIDVFVVLALVGIVWKWPRGIRAPVAAKLRLAYRNLRNAVVKEVRCGSATDFALCLSIAVFSVILGLSAGILQFLLTVAVVLVIVGVLWKWPRAPRLPLSRKLCLALRALWDDLRARFR